MRTWKRPDIISHENKNKDHEYEREKTQQEECIHNKHERNTSNTFQVNQ